MDRRPPPPVSRWCLCLPERTAALGVGALYLAVNAAAIVAGFIFLGVTQGTGQMGPELDAILLPAVLGACLVCMLNVLACALLVVGARRARWELVLAWLAWYGVFQTLLSAAWLGGMAHLVNVVAPAVHPPDTVAFSWRVLKPALPVGIIVLVFVWYAYAAVVVHYRRLRAADHPRKVGSYNVIREA
ncbi:uncharacterized protein LOC119093125 [Pollicipes pollicipes]|uniref:uncharacterized protein LOC119093125 n=1 Tax=Pollicipes pollicipes TaxID=41117 RepID=UPI001885296C|nr:uncharacterized protein LOC119093125 [Pollicipes pollicipes]